MSTHPPTANQNVETDPLFQALRQVLAPLSSIDQKAQLLKPRELLESTFGSAPPEESPLAFYLRAGAAILRLRCEADVTTPIAASDVTTPTGAGAGRFRGETLQRDLTFRRRSKELVDDGRVWLLFQYAGREYDEIADLLGIELIAVFDAAEQATNLIS